MAQETMGTRLLIPLDEVRATGQQFRAQAPQIAAQVRVPLQAIEQTHGLGWTGQARAQYLRLHQPLVQALEHVETRVGTLGTQLGHHASYYAVLNAMRFGGTPGAPAVEGGLEPTEDERVAGITKPLSQDDIKKLLQQYPNGVRRESLSATDQAFVREAETYRDQSAVITKYPGKCWAVDESGGPAILDPIRDASLSDDEKAIPSGYSTDRPYGQYSTQVKDYSDNQLGQYNYHLVPNKENDKWYAGANKDGIADASHAEKQASMRGELSKRVGVNLPQCRSCREYYQAVAQQRGVNQFIADSDMTRIYYPTGEVGIVLQEDGQDVVYIFSKEWATKNLYALKRRLP